MSRAIEDRPQSAPMLAFALDGAPYRSEGLGQRKDVGGDEHIGVPGSSRVQVDPFRRYCDFRHQIGTCKCDALRSKPPQRNAANHPVLFSDLRAIEETTELLGLVVSGDGGCQSHAE